MNKIILENANDMTPAVFQALENCAAGNVIPKKNILLIVAHDLGQHIGPYGVETVHTPNLDRMAAEGTLYENNHCVSPGCSPSCAAIFTEKTFHRDYDPIRAIRTERYKFIINFELNMAYDAPSDVQKGEIYRATVEEWTGLRPRFELYDLKADPWEQTNLADDPSMTGVRDTLRQQLIEWMNKTEDPLLNGPVRSIYCDEILSICKGGSRS